MSFFLFLNNVSRYVLSVMYRPITVELAHNSALCAVRSYIRYSESRGESSRSYINALNTDGV